MTSDLTNNTTPVKPNYDEIDTIRFITISIIVWSHALFPEWRLREPESHIDHIVKAIIIQAGAISTIIFFIVSGILMNAKLQKYTLRSYFRERIPTIYAPWAYIVCINALLMLLHAVPLKELWATRDLTLVTSHLYNIVSALFIYGPYWFVITYLAGMIILIRFKQYSANLFFGLLLAVITIFYCVNFYFQWMDTNHTKAIFAYTFFIWLGFRVQANWKNILSVAKKTHWAFLTVALVLLFMFACSEGVSLSDGGVNDPFASNRLSNILFSLVFFFFLLKVGAIRAINRLEPRKIVYGIYLINSIVILELSVLFHTYLEELMHVNIWVLLGLQLCYFLIVLFITFWIVTYLATSRLRWLIGVR